jgi:hypothetical protein
MKKKMMHKEKERHHDGKMMGHMKHHEMMMKKMHHMMEMMHKHHMKMKGHHGKKEKC